MKWSTKQICDVCEVVPGFAFKGKDLACEGIPVIKIGNITDNRSVDISSARCFPKKLIKNQHSKYFLRNGDVLIAMTGATAGKIGRVRCGKDRVLLVNQRVAKFCPTGIDPDFFWFAISTNRYRKIFYSLGGGAAQPNMSSSQIGAVEIPIPPLSEQHRIASILSTYDDLIENNRRRIQLLEQAARLLYKEWFVRLRFPGHENTKITNGVPEGWEKSTFGKSVENYDRCRVPLSVLERKRRRGTYPYHGAAGVIDYIDDFLFDGRYLLIGEDGTVISPSGSAVIQYVEGKFWVSNHAHVVKGKLVTTDFLYCYMAQYPIRPHITGVAQPKLSQKNLNRIELMIPSHRIRKLFQDAIGPLIDQIFVAKRQNQQLTKARDLLLPRLINKNFITKTTR